MKNRNILLQIFIFGEIIGGGGEKGDSPHQHFYWGGDSPPRPPGSYACVFCANMEIFIRLSESIKLGVKQSEAHFSLFNLGFNMVYFTSFTGIWTCAHQCELFIIFGLEDTSVLRIVFIFGPI